MSSSHDVRQSAAALVDTSKTTELLVAVRAGAAGIDRLLQQVRPAQLSQSCQTPSQHTTHSGGTLPPSL
jgi:hypothetical protein